MSGLSAECCCGSSGVAIVPPQEIIPVSALAPNLGTAKHYITFIDTKTFRALKIRHKTGQTYETTG